MGQTWILEFSRCKKGNQCANVGRSQRNYGKCKNVVDVVVLLPEAGDSGSRESDVEDVADSMEEIFEPAGELKVEEDFESDEELLS